MQKIFIIISVLAMLLLREECHGQGTVKYTAGISYGTGAPTYTPTGNVSKKYINLTTLRSYTYSGASWVIDGQGIDVISGCSAPNYTPGIGQSNIVINSCTVAQNGQGPELYYYTGSTWIFINEKSTAPTYTAGTGIGITGDVITNTGDLSNTNELQTLSVVGNNLSISDGNTVTLPTPSSTLDALTDVTITSPTNGQILTYNSGLWQNSAIGLTWPLLAPNGSKAAPSYSFSAVPNSGMYMLNFLGSNRIQLSGGDGTGTNRGVSLYGVAGNSETNTPGVISYNAGNSSGNIGGSIQFSAGSTISTNTGHNGGSVTFLSGPSANGRAGNILLQIGGGAMPGFIIFQRAYTLTSTADANGSTGSFSWDDNYIYIKTSSGWKRAALSSF